MENATDLALEHLKIEERAGFTIIRFNDGRILDDVYIRYLSRELLGLVTKERKHFLVDFSNVEFLAYSFVSTLLTFRRRIKDVNGALAFFKLSRDAWEVLRLNGLDREFVIYAQEKDVFEKQE